MRHARLSRQSGAVILTVSLMLLFLLGFMGLALDFGRAFVVRTELQSAVDSCALAAAQELDGGSDAILRARSAGIAAGNGNGVYFQSANWKGAGQLTDASLVFRDSFFTETGSPTAARYAECAHAQANGQPWLLQAVATFGGNAAIAGPAAIGARAVATRAHAQSACPIPAAMRPKAGGTAPDYGYAVGEWVTLITSPGAVLPGHVGWANLDGSSSASETEAEMNGRCGTEVGDTLGTPGAQAAIVDTWNYRFGIYKNTGDPSQPLQRPDLTGYAYTLQNWPSGANAYDGATPPAAHPSAASYVVKRAAFASCADTGTQLRGSSASCEGITGLTLNSFQKLAAPGNGAGGHRDHGLSRRLVIVPMIDDANKVIDYACMFMLQPLAQPMTDTQLEYRGNAAATGSPCTTSGLPGGNTGPLVPVLVR